MTAMHAQFRERYGPWAVVAGASEGLGEEFARQLAARGLRLVLVARRADVLRGVARRIADEHGVEVRDVALDLARPESFAAVVEASADLEVGLLVYNAAFVALGSFLAESLESHIQELEVNCRRPLELSHHFGRAMLERGRGGILLMSSLAGAQGAPGISHYMATKSWSRVLAEGMWAELRDNGVDVLACCAGATRTPRYLAHRNPAGGYVPEQEPDAVAREALSALGSTPSMVPGHINRAASFVLQRLLPRRRAVEIMGRASRGVGSGGRP